MNHITNEIKERIKALNKISSVQLIENTDSLSIEELEEILPSLYAEADAIICAIQNLHGAVNKTKD